MTLKKNESFFKLLRLAMGEPLEAPFLLSDEEWVRIYELADKQSLLGVVFSAVQKLPPESRPPMSILFQWSSEAETVKGLNRLMNKECARLTELFESEGHSTAILKGQANARLYPDPLSRQPGDIDIWVSGGERKTNETLARLGLIEKEGPSDEHHVQLDVNEKGITIEVHFLPCSGNMNPFSTRRMLKYLDKELGHNGLVPEGFKVPSMKFALVMQLSHVQRHYFCGGVGIRQLMDYYLLLRKSTVTDREEVSALLKKFGMMRFAGALMWLLREVFDLPENEMLCAMDESRGKMLLHSVFEGGDFGRYKNGPRLKWLFWFLNKRRIALSYCRLDVSETLWGEYCYWKKLLKTVPFRLRSGKVSLRGEWE